jgi:type IV secretory pathway VirB2 component (pilin)
MSEPYIPAPPVGDSLDQAVLWIEQLLFGQFGIAIAVLAVGLTGFRLLLGYSSPKEMTRIVAGCFILFGASAISHALAGFADARYASVPKDLPAPEVAPIRASAPAPAASQVLPAGINPFDPYSGAGSR